MMCPKFILSTRILPCVLTIALMCSSRALCADIPQSLITAWGNYTSHFSNCTISTMVYRNSIFGERKSNVIYDSSTKSTASGFFYDCKIFDEGSTKPYSHTIFASNAQYAFELSPKNDQLLLKDYAVVGTPQYQYFIPNIEKYRRASIVVIAINGDSVIEMLKELLLDDNGHIKNRGEFFAMRPSNSKLKRKYHNIDITLSSDEYRLPVSVQADVTDGNSPYHFDATYHYQMDGQIPVLKEEKWKKTFSATPTSLSGTEESALTYNTAIMKNADPKELYLSHFGLPEPLGIEKSRETKYLPNYVWLIVAAIVLALFGFIAKRMSK